VVGIGGSAGSLDALEQLFAATAPDTGMAFVVVTHLDPDHKTLLAELLQRTTAMPVRQIEDGLRLTPDAVFVIPPNRVLEVDGELLRLRPASRAAPRTPIDAFFRSLAHEHGDNAVGLVLSGSGEDGARGLAAIVEAGGAALVQEPTTAAFEAMPRAAIAAVPTAVVAAPEALPEQLGTLRGDATTTTGPVVARILELVRRRTGHDLNLYKPSSIVRRIERRIAAVQAASIEDYAAYLEANPDEADLVFRELLIGVTQFFRDPETYAVLRDLALPALVATKREPRTFRAWIAGCSTGEEAYSLAIVIHEVFQAARADDVSVKIYATDLDDNAIATARAGAYPDQIAAHVTADRLARYFTREERGFRIRKEIRDMVVFAKHDLIADPPFTRLDLLSCRNVLIYMQASLQQELIPKFHYALVAGGLLVLGAAETASSRLFTAVDAKAKVFRKLDVARGARSSIELAVTSRPVPAPAQRSRGTAELTVVEAARRVIVDSLAPPTVVINDRGDILYSSRRTGRYLEPPVGKTNINIFAMAREGLGPHLGIAVRQALAKHRRVNVAGIGIRGDRGRTMIDLSVVPMEEPESLRGLLLVVFDEVAKPAKRGKAGKTGKVAGRKLPAALGRELARTKEHLQSVVREMEASQAQVEATSEEMQSANEELQSTNEELTTSKEELQSLNEELMTLNAELEAKNDELMTANDDLRNLLNATKVPTLFLDNKLRIKRFTSEATRVANLIAGDVGRAITDITLKVDYEGLAGDVAEVLDSLVFKEVQVNGLDGASYTMRIHPYRTMNNVIDGVVISFSDVTALRRAEAALAARSHDTVIARLLDRWPGLVYVRDLVLGRDIYLNDRARARLAAAAPGARLESLIDAGDATERAAWQDRVLRLRDDEVLTRAVQLRAIDGGYDRCQSRESVLARAPSGAPTRVLAVLEPLLIEQD